LDGVSYPSVENAYQAAKTLDLGKRELFYNVTPVDAKKLGKQLILREDWENIKINIMKDLIKQKFKNEELKKLLIETNNVVLTEGNNWHDIFWGKCYCKKHNREGENHLGKIIMAERELMRTNCSL
jgi:ribA/ribD-fused uncharacterized protein